MKSSYCPILSYRLVRPWKTSEKMEMLEFREFGHMTRQSLGFFPRPRPSPLMTSVLRSPGFIGI